MHKSRIKDHKVRGGKVISPWNYSLGQTMKFSSWAKNRLPEYIWLALIMDVYGRDKGLRFASTILQDIARCDKDLVEPKLSKIISLPPKRQEAIYKCIIKTISKNTLSPLTVFVDGDKHELFWEFFYQRINNLKKQIEVLERVIRTNYFHQSNEATDVRYLVIMNRVFQGKIFFSRDCGQTIEALQNYPLTNHEDEKMRMYRPMVRAGEMFTEEVDVAYIDNFWKSIGNKMDCKLHFIAHKDGDMNCKPFINDIAEALEFVWCKHKEEGIYDERFSVVLAMVTYSYKILNETVVHKIGNTLSARATVRMVAEVYIMIKYLIKLSQDKPNVWKEFKQYGIGKYKLILLKLRETEVDPKSHLVADIIDVLVNEETWEEFIDSDLRYFDQVGIRDKAISVGEKELYDLLYDYDSSYAHGLWGAIRESAMIPCDNAAHQYHSVPDIFMKQNASDVIPDMVSLMKRTLALLDDLYEVPEWFKGKYLS